MSNKGLVYTGVAFLAVFLVIAMVQGQKPAAEPDKSACSRAMIESQMGRVSKDEMREKCAGMEINGKPIR